MTSKNKTLKHILQVVCFISFILFLTMWFLWFFIYVGDDFYRYAKMIAFVSVISGILGEFV